MSYTNASLKQAKREEKTAGVATVHTHSDVHSSSDPVLDPKNLQQSCIFSKSLFRASLLLEDKDMVLESPDFVPREKTKRRNPVSLADFTIMNSDRTWSRQI